MSKLGEGFIFQNKRLANFSRGNVESDSRGNVKTCKADSENSSTDDAGSDAGGLWQRFASKSLGFFSFRLGSPKYRKKIGFSGTRVSPSTRRRLVLHRAKNQQGTERGCTPAQTERHASSWPSQEVHHRTQRKVGRHDLMLGWPDQVML